ncbi:dihydroflavonol-4-reductase [Leptospira kobayashii]|uniref:Dihydroflavonol-4-reductase n=1 Tax=Leptospira kobayashii TaxID=1917830 RepID=A0ABN6K905_9LEPT|nr:NAD-dependent epimerase/dehydratase family protein [Leptospira kobayashii]BDA77405.1 dihydroflavonol-4-reductase [Leptospira kobayashii]
MKILVTGATGMVGANIVSELLKSGGDKVSILARSKKKAEKLFPKNVNILLGDITDKESLKIAVSGQDIVYHSAGLPEQWFRDPSLFTKTNVEGTRNVLEAAKNAKVKRVVYTSTIDVFQGFKDQTYDESVLDPNPKGTYYERSKQEADRIAVEYLNEGMDIVFLHPSGVYGLGPISSPGPNGLMKDLILGKVPMLLPGGFPIVFAKDCAIGHILAAKQGKAGDRFILSESYLSLKDFAVLVNEIKPIPKMPRVMPLSVAKLFSTIVEGFAWLTGHPPLLPKGQLHFLQWQAIPSAEKAKKVLGWKPTDAKEGFRQTIGSF